MTKSARWRNRYWRKRARGGGGFALRRQIDVQKGRFDRTGLAGSAAVNRDVAVGDEIGLGFIPTLS
jgi:hypothetical protein